MQVVFFGTPDFAVPTLEALIADEGITVLAAVSQPDRPAGRGQKMHAPPVKVLCDKYHIPVFQPEKLSKAQDVIEALRNLKPDLIIMVAFGQILKKEVLAIPKFGVINLHASLLPAYRGAAPINWAIINGDTTTGITTMFTESGLDTGPMLLKDEVTINVDTNAAQLSRVLAEQGAQLVIKTIDQLRAGTLKAQPQDDSQSTYAPLLSKSTGQIHWTNSADKIHNLIRGLIPWPIAHTVFRGHPIKIWRTSLVSKDQLQSLSINHKPAPGQIFFVNKQILVSCGEDTFLEIKEVQPLNKSKLAASDWANGIHLQADEIFTL